MTRPRPDQLMTDEQKTLAVAAFVTALGNQRAMLAKLSAAGAEPGMGYDALGDLSDYVPALFQALPEDQAEKLANMALQNLLHCSRWLAQDAARRRDMAEACSDVARTVRDQHNLGKLRAGTL